MFSANNAVLIQYHGGTNFGRSASAFVITSYYDEAPLDEYGKILNVGFHESISLVFYRKWIPISTTRFHLSVFCFHIVILTVYVLSSAGSVRQPKWGHLKELHAAVKLASNSLLSGDQTNVSLGELQDVRTLTRTSRHFLYFFLRDWMR